MPGDITAGTSTRACRPLPCQAIVDSPTGGTAGRQPVESAVGRSDG